MSTLSVTKIETANGTTDLTIGTGNTTGASFVISSTTGTVTFGNSTSNVTLTSSGLSSQGNTTINGFLNVTGNVNIDSGMLFVDGTNNKVGIGTTTPFNQTVTFVNAIDPVISQDGGYYGGGLYYDSGWRNTEASQGGWAIRNSGGNFTLYTGAANGVAGSIISAGERVRVNSSGHVTTPNQPSFHAYGLNNFANGSFVIYPSTYFNVGGHYSTTTGRFTAPVTGYYLFGWTSIANITGDVYRWRFGVNGATVGDTHLRQDTTATGSEYADNGTFVIPWYLTAGDYVSIYFSSDGGNLPYHHNTATGEYPRFWGHLMG